MNAAFIRALSPAQVTLDRSATGDGYPLVTYTAPAPSTLTIAGAHTLHVFSVNLFNITNQLYRNHLSFIKDLAPEIGRGVRFSYNLHFY